MSTVHSNIQTTPGELRRRPVKCLAQLHTARRAWLRSRKGVSRARPFATLLKRGDRREGRGESGAGNSLRIGQPGPGRRRGRLPHPCPTPQEHFLPQSEFHHKNLVHTVLSLFFAGTESSSTTLRYGLLLFLKHPEVTEKVQAEIDRVIGPQRLPALEDRAKMPYTDAVIHEIQRYSDLTPIGVPHSVIKDTHFRGYHLVKGTAVYPIMSSVLHDPHHFEKPDVFYPGHFLDAEGNFRKREAFVPFSMGKRICLGESLARSELFLFFTSMLQNFSLGCPKAPEDIDLTPRVNGLGKLPPVFQLRFLPRQREKEGTQSPPPLQASEPPLSTGSCGKSRL